MPFEAAIASLLVHNLPRAGHRSQISGIANHTHQPHSRAGDTFRSPAPQPYALASVFLEQDTDRKSQASQPYAPALIASRRHFQISSTATICTSLCLPWSGHRSQVSGIAIIRTSLGLIEESITLIDTTKPSQPRSRREEHLSDRWTTTKPSQPLFYRSIFLIDGLRNHTQIRQPASQ